MHPLLLDLNAEQQKAVAAPLTHMLILAGAGSGKTRVLVHRMAYLASELHIPLHHMLAVTFTNKAAREIRHRVETLTGMPHHGLWLGTFHGIAHRLLRMHFKEANLPEYFQVMDSDDQLRVIKRMLKDQNLDDKYYSPDKIQHFINQNKEQGLRPQQLNFNERDLYRKTLAELYALYQQICERNGLLDFAELLLRTLELFQNNPSLKTDYQNRFQAILVDEFQDTNTIQYLLLKELLGPHNYLLVVGDDDQSIYSWRGAKIENIHKVQRDYPGMVIRLEQNYRSTQTILDAANAVIAHNEKRLGKELWSEGERGRPIQVYSAFNELDEARFVVSRIESLMHKGHKADHIAILYRANAQSRVFEEALMQERIPYRVYGGLRFFDRAEIKNALAYARFVMNPNDDTAFERIINFPARGIGEKTLSTIRDLAKSMNQSLWQVLSNGHSLNLPARAIFSLQNFVSLITELQAQTTEQAPNIQLQKIIDGSGLIPYYQAEPDEKSQDRVENLQELLNAIDEFCAHSEKNGQTPHLNDFLAHATLESSTDQTLVGDAIQLMTLHAAKGLEFPCVFLVGMEEELFPGRACQEDAARLEEERRLCYVGMTRAMEELTLSYAEYRRLYGETKSHMPSRFLMEIPKICLESVKAGSSLGAPHRGIPPLRTSFASKGGRGDQTTPSKIDNSIWKLGTPVTHPTFGEGIVLATEGQGPEARLQIKFRAVGTKWMVAQFVQANGKENPFAEL